MPDDDRRYLTPEDAAFAATWEHVLAARPPFPSADSWHEDEENVLPFAATTEPPADPEVADAADLRRTTRLMLCFIAATVLTLLWQALEHEFTAAEVADLGSRVEVLEQVARDERLAITASPEAQKLMGLDQAAQGAQ